MQLFWEFSEMIPALDPKCRGCSKTIMLIISPSLKLLRRALFLPSYREAIKAHTSNLPQVRGDQHLARTEPLSKAHLLIPRTPHWVCPSFREFPQAELNPEIQERGSSLSEGHLKKSYHDFPSPMNIWWLE